MQNQSIHHRRIALVCLIGLVCGTCGTAQAYPPGRGGESRHDHERARHALARGEARPIAEILHAVASEIPGEVIEVEFERKRLGHEGAKIWIYELKIIASDGRLLEVLVDAATARILEVEED